jgi:hypothetical protein
VAARSSRQRRCAYFAFLCGFSLRVRGEKCRNSARIWKDPRRNRAAGGYLHATSLLPKSIRWRGEFRRIKFQTADPTPEAHEIRQDSNNARTLGRHPYPRRGCCPRPRTGPGQPPVHMAVRDMRAAPGGSRRTAGNSEVIYMSGRQTVDVTSGGELPAFRKRGRFPFSGHGHTTERHLVAVTLSGAVWPGQARRFGKVRSLFAFST